MSTVTVLCPVSLELTQFGMTIITDHTLEVVEVAHAEQKVHSYTTFQEPHTMPANESDREIASQRESEIPLLFQSLYSGITITGSGNYVGFETI